MRALVVMGMMVAALAVRGAWLLLWKAVHVLGGIGTCRRVVSAAVAAAVIPRSVAVARVLLLLRKTTVVGRGSTGCRRVGSVAFIASIP